MSILIYYLQSAWLPLSCWRSSHCRAFHGRSLSGICGTCGRRALTHLEVNEMITDTQCLAA